MDVQKLSVPELYKILISENPEFTSYSTLSISTDMHTCPGTLTIDIIKHNRQGEVYFSGVGYCALDELKQGLRKYSSHSAHEMRTLEEIRKFVADVIALK